MGSPHWRYLLINHTIFPPCLFQWEHFAAGAPCKSLHTLTSSAAFVKHLNKAWWCQRAGFNKASFSAKHLSMFLTFNALTCAQQGMSSKLSKGFGTSWTWSLGAWPCTAWPSMLEWEPGQGRGVNTPVPLHWQGMTSGTVAAHSHHHAAGTCTLCYPLDPEARAVRNEPELSSAGRAHPGWEKVSLWLPQHPHPMCYCWPVDVITGRWRRHALGQELHCGQDFPQTNPVMEISSCTKRETSQRTKANQCSCCPMVICLWKLWKLIRSFFTGTNITGLLQSSGGLPTSRTALPKWPHLL